MNVVLFLGAGFSAQFGHPVMNQFLTTADRSNRISPEDKLLIGRLVLEARSANSFLQSSPTNLEDILSFAVMKARVAIEHNGDNDDTNIRTILQRIYTDPSNPDNSLYTYKQFRDFLGFNPRDNNHRLSVITTNYDMNIECALYFNSLTTNLGINHKPIVAGNKSKYYTDRGIQVFKLHGSVNWYKDDSDDTCMIVDGRTSQYFSDATPKTEFILPSLCRGDYKAPCAPVIVPPSFLKNDIHPLLKRVWAGASGALRAANLVVFVGYSFPQSDVEMMYFFASAFSNNDGLRAIWVVDPQADIILEKLRAPNSKLGTHFQEFLRPRKELWINTRLEVDSLYVNSIVLR